MIPYDRCGFALRRDEKLRQHTARRHVVPRLAIAGRDRGMPFCGAMNLGRAEVGTESMGRGSRE